MQNPVFERTELFHIGRVLGALLVLFGGLALLLQAYFIELVPPADGYVKSVATVHNLEQAGSIPNPSFLVTLEYLVEADDQQDTILSGQFVEFEQYFALGIGDTVNVHYDPNNPQQWRIEPDSGELSQYGLGFLMVIFGLLSLTLPQLLSWASRREDFEFKDEYDADELIGVTKN